MEARFERFTVMITKISRNIRRIKAEEMESFNLKSSHVSCLYYLYVYGTLTATELCEKCDEDKALISRSVDYLETCGYLACESKNTKRYKSPLSLTEKGRKTGEEIVKKVDRVLDEVSVGLSDAEREEFYRALTIISTNLDNIK